MLFLSREMLGRIQNRKGEENEHVLRYLCALHVLGNGPFHCSRYSLQLISITLQCSEDIFPFALREERLAGDT